MPIKNQDLFEKIGVNISKDKIHIDINQTKDFFHTLQNTFEQTAQKMQDDITVGKVDMAANVGIKIDKDNINIDFSKTKNFIEELGKKIEHFLGEIDKAVENIDKK